MKFMLGHFMLDGVRKRYTTVVARHDGHDYRFERWEELAPGVFGDRIRVYESDDYPAPVVRTLFETGQAVEVVKRVDRVT